MVELFFPLKIKMSLVQDTLTIASTTQPVFTTLGVNSTGQLAVGSESVSGTLSVPGTLDIAGTLKISAITNPLDYTGAPSRQLNLCLPDQTGIAKRGFTTGGIFVGYWDILTTAGNSLATVSGKTFYHPNSYSMNGKETLVLPPPATGIIVDPLGTVDFGIYTGDGATTKFWVKLDNFDKNRIIRPSSAPNLLSDTRLIYFNTTDAGYGATAAYTQPNVLYYPWDNGNALDYWRGEIPVDFLMQFNTSAAISCRVVLIFHYL